jgi:hypothetical protein
MSVGVASVEAVQHVQQQQLAVVQVISVSTAPLSKKNFA